MKRKSVPAKRRELIFGKASRDEARMEQRASQLISLLAHCDVSAGQAQPPLQPAQLAVLATLFEIARLQYANEIFVAAV